MMQKKLLVVTQFFNIITAIDFDAKKPARYSWELVQARIQDFPEVRAPTLRGGGGRQHTILPNFPKNC